MTSVHSTRERRQTIEGDSEGEENGLTEAGQELHRILRKARISSGSEDGDGAPSSGAGEDEEEEEFNDDVDLDEMASGILPKVSPYLLSYSCGSSCCHRMYFRVAEYTHCEDAEDEALLNWGCPFWDAERAVK